VSQGPPVVAVFNSSDDTVELIRAWFERVGIVVVSAHLDEIKRGSFDLSSFVEQHKPAAMLIDIAPPYDRSWLFVQHLINNSPLSGVPAIFTTTNERHVREAAGPADVIELVGKPYDLDLLLERVGAVTGIRAS
jgi:DNA-binding response OmpR family regulator